MYQKGKKDNDILSEIFDELSYEIHDQKLLKNLELRLRSNFGGTFGYISKKSLIRERNEKILNDFKNQTDINKLCYKYNLSYYWILKILEKSGASNAKKSNHQNSIQQQLLFA